MSPALTLWSLDEVVLVSSVYAIAEAERNLDDVELRARLYGLLRKVEVVAEPPTAAELPKGIQLPGKDVPIMLAATHARCTHLLTGDLKHFGPLLNRIVKGVRVSTIRDYLNERRAG